MTIANAKEIIAAYLSGRRRVSLEELQLACETANGDKSYVRYLRIELGFGDDWANTCRVFLANVAEFAELTAAERAQEMPELIAHLEQCGACRAVYWDVQETWKQVAVAEFEEATAISKSLPEGIHLRMDAAGQLHEYGMGPPAQYSEPPRALLGDWASEARSPASEQKTWLLKDEAAHCRIHILAHGLESGRAALKCWLEAKPPLDATSARIDVLDAQTDALHVSGKLSAFQVDPIYLSQGAWLIRIIAYSDGDARTWEFPLNIRRDEPDRR